MRTTFKIEKKHYNIIKEIADDNQTDLTEVVDLLFDYIFDNNIYKNFGKAFSNSKEEIEIETSYDYINEWSEEYKTKQSTIFEYMIEEIEEFKKEYELV